MRKYLGILLVALCLPAARAADLPPALGTEVSLPQLLELVKTSSPALQAERTQVAMAEADLMTAQTFSNPSVGYTHKRGEKETTISQDIPIFGQRGARIESARSGVDAARAQLRLVYAQALQDAARDFMSLLVSQEREKRWLDAKDDLEGAFRIVQGQVQAGARSRYDLTRLEVERASLDAQLAQAQAETLQASARVAASVGAPAWRPRAAGSIVSHWTALNFDAIWPQAQNRLPSVRAALAQQAYAEKQLEAERRQAYPTPTFMVGRLNNSEGRSTEYGVSVAIPLFDRNQGPIARAAAEADGMRLRSRAIVVAAESELRRATEQLGRRQQLADRFEKEGLSMIPRLRQMAQDSYTLGRGSILDLVDAIQAVAEKKNTYLDLLEAVMQAEVDVRIASGELGADLLE
ncbi:TolC family protein [Pigmentiphaga kullae]|uniref:Cobalt-zinc-cadmium efflux system outer membrane protein n=1 Tax=Pigmentiphaga kullae TaxID=151784 RepID=A0A4Q7N969_9BURK|nr:TolC family protein [Pigmentiphaga kullae]RZS78633.1 cobalt-zinc-cadmium efflux system outer membrane protein [Pigmentiphaga kullae]